MFITFFHKEKTTNNSISFEKLFKNPNTTFEIIERKQITIETNLPKQIPANIAIYRTMLLNLIQNFPQIMTYTPETLAEKYTQYNVPKKSGTGYRPINAPSEDLKMLQRHILDTLQKFNVLMHDSAHAYIKGRSPKTAMKVHQKHNSKWFLHMDLKNFFNSCSQEFVYEQISKVYPFSLLKLDEKCDKIIKQIINIACLNGSLPQGNPLAPYFTNLLMVPLDYHLNKLAPVYTRFSDDMLFSSKRKHDLDIKTITNAIAEIFKDTPLKINHEKTRLGSRNGNNWNLGLMLNKDNKLTVGHETKRQYKATIDQFLYNPEKYTVEQIQQLAGITSYYKSIEPEYFANIIQKYSIKHNKDLLKLLHTLT